MDSQPLDRFDNEQVGAHATLHIIRPAAIDAIAFDLTAESAARPWLRAARNGVDMAREQQRASAARTLAARAYVRSVRVVAPVPIKRMLLQANHLVEPVDAWLPSTAA